LQLAGPTGAISLRDQGVDFAHIFAICVNGKILIQELFREAQTFAFRSSYSETAFLQLARPTGVIGLRDQGVDFAPVFLPLFPLYIYFALTREKDRTGDSS
jgi:hypothetical protein